MKPDSKTGLVILNWFRPDEVDWVSVSSTEAQRTAKSDVHRTSGTEILRHRIPMIMKLRRQHVTVNGIMFAAT